MTWVDKLCINTAVRHTTLHFDFNSTLMNRKSCIEKVECNS